MKTFHLFILLCFVSCEVELHEETIMPRSGNHITYNPVTPCNGAEVTVAFDNGYANNCGTSRIQQHINNHWTTVCEGVPVDGLLTYSFTPSPGTYRFRASWNKSGKNCHHPNIKNVEEDPLEVVEKCCDEYFTATAICDSTRECVFGLEFHFMAAMANWITITGQLEEGYELCGFYDSMGNIIEVKSGNVIEIGADVPECTEFWFYVYFNAPVQNPSFGVWKLTDMHGLLYHLEPPPCNQS